MAQTPSPNYNDAQLLSNDPTFQNRVQEALMRACANITSEAFTTALHVQRQRYVQQIMQNPASFVKQFADIVAQDATVLADATVAGGTPLTSGNAATQAPLVQDAHIDNAIAANFNAFISQF